MAGQKRKYTVAARDKYMGKCVGKTRIDIDRKERMGRKWSGDVHG